MANSLLTLNMITAEAVALWKNSNAYIQAIDTQYDDSFAKTGAKIGTQLRIRLPNDYTVTSGPALSAQSTTETNTVLTVANQLHVDVSFNSVDRTMSLDDYSERVLAPMVNNLAGAVAFNVMTNTAEMACNGVFNQATPSSPGVAPTATLSPTITQAFLARATLAENSAPSTKRSFVLDPRTMARATGSAAGLFNPATAISKQYMDGMIYQAGGFSWMEDQTVLKHVTGTFSATANTVNGAGQTGQTLVVNATTGTLNKGDLIFIANVNSVNRITKQSNASPRTFVVTANVPAGSTSIPIYPAIVPPTTINGVSTPVQYQTVDSSPANGAAVSLVNLAGETYRKNVSFDVKAVTMATADLIAPEKGVVEVARKNMDGVAMRMLSAYVPGTDEIVTRLDVLFGSQAVRPEWMVIVGDAI